MMLHHKFKEVNSLNLDFEEAVKEWRSEDMRAGKRHISNVTSSTLTMSVSKLVSILLQSLWTIMSLKKENSMKKRVISFGKDSQHSALDTIMPISKTPMLSVVEM
jgi:hypothetical protein